MMQHAVSVSLKIENDRLLQENARLQTRCDDFHMELQKSHFALKDQLHEERCEKMELRKVQEELRNVQEELQSQLKQERKKNLQLENVIRKLQENTMEPIWHVFDV